MSSENFIVRRNIYLDSHKDDETRDSVELPAEKKAEKNEVDSTITEDVPLNDGRTKSKSTR